MTYVKSYFKAFGHFFLVFGVIGLIISILENRLESLYFLYVSAVGAIAGPVDVLLRKRNK